jgi:hypothetical protein
MQLTRFDRWLRETFVYETHIQTLRPPQSIPAGIRTVTLPNVADKRYKHLFVTNSGKAANTLISQLKANSQMYTAQVVDRDAWFVPFLAPKNKSVTWWFFSLLVFSTSAFFILLYLKGLLDDPEFRRNFTEALEIIQK